MRSRREKAIGAAGALVAVACVLGLSSSASEARVGPDRAPVTPAPRGAAPARPFTVAVISDLNGSYGATTYGDAVHGAVDRILERAPDLVLSTGDMVAGQRRGLDHGAMWEGFHSAVSDRLRDAGIPFAVTPGNHDASGYRVFAGERALFEREWTARRPDVEFQDDSHYPLRYSFAAGPALFVSLDATTVGPLDDEQMEWLDEQLTRGAHHPVKIVFGHVPLHPFAEGRANQSISDARLEAMLVRHGVELFVSGHHHAYYPGRRGRLRLVSTACLGAGARPLLGQRRRSERSLIFFTLDRDGVHGLDAWAGEAFTRRIERASLPAHVGRGSAIIDRDDLARLRPALVSALR